jgi:8-oxo-dGTP diphosphatase
MSAPIIEVAAAVLLREGCFLLAQRPAGKVYAGYWEFPGGKIESGETALYALCRELHEELGIEITEARQWLTRVFTYPHATVRLNFFRVTDWRGEPHGRENQALSWQSLPHLSVGPLLPANAPILRALQLPPLYAISNVAELGRDEFLRRLRYALNAGLRLVQVREKNLPRDELCDLSLQVIAMAHAHGTRVLLNGDIELARETGADGVHLSSAQLAACRSRPDVEWCAASCHTAAELRRAAELELDFAVLGPVQPTLSHPGVPHLGWEKFAALIAPAQIPVYALGGLRIEDLARARQCGAHGIALMRQAWRSAS